MPQEAFRSDVAEKAGAAKRIDCWYIGDYSPAREKSDTRNKKHSSLAKSGREGGRIGASAAAVTKSSGSGAIRRRGRRAGQVEDDGRSIEAMVDLLMQGLAARGNAGEAAAAIRVEATAHAPA